jgi:hypothetical protein
MRTPKLTNDIITAAILGFEDQKRRIDSQISELRAILPGGSISTAATPEAPTRKRRKFSAAARRRMKEAQQRRWAKVRQDSESPAPETPEAAKTKPRISKEGMARIIAATKKRWANVRAAKAQQSRAATRKVAVKKSVPKSVAKKAAHKKAAVKKTTPASGPAAATP